MHLQTMPMVSFFRARAPDVVKSVEITVSNGEVDKVFEEGTTETLASSGEKEEKEGVVAVEYSKVLVPLSGGPTYLFTGKLEAHVIGEQLVFVIRTYTGEWVGNIKYGCVLDGGRRVIDLRRRKIIRTVSHVKYERYFVYLDYGGGRYVALKMELCPGDEELLEELIVQYGGGM